MNRKDTARCRPTRPQAALAISTMLATMALPGGAAHAQCSTFNLVLGPPSTDIFAVGQTFQVVFEFGASAHPVGGFMDIASVSLHLDCAGDTACPTCVDEGQILLFADNLQYIHGADPDLNRDVMITHTPPSNVVTFTFVDVGTNTPHAARFNAPTVRETVLFQFDLMVNSIGGQPSPKNLISKLEFLGDCNAGTDAFACVSYEVGVVRPDIEIVKTACPSLVCATGENVTYGYSVTTGGGNAPIVGSTTKAHEGSLPAQALDGTWHRAIEVRDDTCGPGGPNTLLILPGDTNANGLLDPGENWAVGGDTNNNAELELGETWQYECVTAIASPTTNIVEVEGEYVNQLGSIDVEASDSATVDTVIVTETPGTCARNYSAATSGCTGETCVWTGPSFASNSCNITLNATNLPGEYCVTVTCPGCDSTCEPGCEGGNPARSATCCIEFTPPTIPVVIVTGDRACEGEPDPVICAVVTGGRPGQAGYTVQWFLDNPSEGCDPTGAALETDTGIQSGGQSCFTPSVPGRYVAVATDSNGCVGKDCGSVISHPSRVVVAEDVTECESTLPADLCATASGGTGPDYDITWFEPDGITQISQCLDWSVGDAPCCISRSVAGIYIVRVVDSANCEDEDTAELIIDPNPTCSVDPPTSCNPRQVLTATGFGECDGSFTFTWTKDGDPFPGGENGVLQADGIGEYCAVVTCSTSLCTGDDPCCASVDELPPCEFFCVDNACVGDREEFCGPSGFDFYTWVVTGACQAVGRTDEQCVHIDFGSGEGAGATCFIDLTVSTESGCEATCSDSVQVFDNRTCQIEGPDKGCLGDSKIYCGPPGMAAYTWMTAGQCSVDSVNSNQCVVIKYNGNGDCTVSLHVNNEAGCAGDCSIHVEVCECAVCIEIPPPDQDPICGSSGNELTATVENVGPDTEFEWVVLFGPCLIQGPDDEVTVTYIIGADTETEVTCGFKFEVHSGNCFAPPSKCMIEVTCMPEPCGEGCSVTFWKNKSHAGFWPEGYVPNVTCGTPTLFCNIFSCSTAASQTAFGGKTMLEVLQTTGNGLKSLGRQAVAALLNAEKDPEIVYALGDAHVIALVNAAIASGDAEIINDLKNDLLAFNVQGCPIGGQSFCVDLNLDGSVGNPDMQILLNNWGHAGQGDLDQNGVVGPADLMILMANWGTY